MRELSPTDQADVPGEEGTEQHRHSFNKAIITGMGKSMGGDL
jgi:hypothetical protein